MKTTHKMTALALAVCLALAGGVAEAKGKGKGKGGHKPKAHDVELSAAQTWPSTSPRF